MRTSKPPPRRVDSPSNAGSRLRQGGGQELVGSGPASAATVVGDPIGDVVVQRLDARAGVGDVRGEIAAYRFSAASYTLNCVAHCALVTAVTAGVQPQMRAGSSSARWRTCLRLARAIAGVRVSLTYSYSASSTAVEML